MNYSERFTMADVRFIVDDAVRAVPDGPFPGLTAADLDAMAQEWRAWEMVGIIWGTEVSIPQAFAVGHRPKACSIAALSSGTFATSRRRNVAVFLR